MLSAEMKRNKKSFDEAIRVCSRSGLVNFEAMANVGPHIIAKRRTVCHARIIQHSVIEIASTGEHSKVPPVHLQIVRNLCWRTNQVAAIVVQATIVTVD